VLTYNEAIDALCLATARRLLLLSSMVLKGASALTQASSVEPQASSLKRIVENSWFEYPSFQLNILLAYRYAI
jgi:hypothetical protein